MHWIYFFKKLFIQGWNYLKQPVFDLENPTVWNPIKFNKKANVYVLEKCWELEYIPNNKQYDQQA